MAAKTTTKRSTTTKKKPASKARKTASKPAAKKASTRKKVGDGKAVAQKKAAAKKKAATKRTTPKTAAGKTTAARKTASRQTAAKKKAPARKKAVAKKQPTDRKKVVEKKVASRKLETKKAKPAKRKRAAKKKVSGNDPLAPRPKSRVAKLDVLLPGRRKAHHNNVKAKRFRALTKKQQEHYRQQLLELRDRISGQISSLKKDSLTRADEVNIEEDGTDAFDRQFALNLASSESEALVAIDKALQRIADGEFGKCLECGGGIETARMKAIPFVENCITCQSAVEKNHPSYRAPVRLD